MYFYKTKENLIIDSKELIENDNYKLLKEFEIDGAYEKHVPVYDIKDGIIDINVGSQIHPMLSNHYIEFIAVETDKSYYKKVLKPDDLPNAKFIINDEKVIAVYEYCNLHGLWKNK